MLPRKRTPNAVEIASKSDLISWLRWNDRNGDYPSSMSKLAAVINQARAGAIAFDDQIG